MSSYFIKVEDATDLRRKILESSKGSIHMLRGYQNLLMVRNKKLTLFRRLRRELKELTMLTNRIEKLMPTLSKSDVQALHAGKKIRRKPGPSPDEDVYLGEKEIHVKDAMKEVKKAKKRAPAHKASELETLQSKLAAIEGKLKDI